jgi:stage IV sporulation protein FB
MGVWAFRLFGFPVAVEPWFWLVTLMLGASGSPATLPAWVAAVFVSVLAHELGHALLGRAYGLHPAIRLHGFGGVTIWRSSLRLGPLRSALLSLAGPLAGFAFGAVIWLVATILPFEGRFLGALVRDLVWISVAWGVLNLLPILPLDGGNIMRSAVHAWRGSGDDRLPLQISIGMGGAAILLAISYEAWLTAMFMGLMTWDNYQSLQRQGPPRARYS